MLNNSSINIGAKCFVAKLALIIIFFKAAACFAQQPSGNLSNDDTLRIRFGADTIKMPKQKLLEMNREIRIDGKEPKEFTSSEIDSLLSSGNYSLRIKAAKILGSGEVVDTIHSLERLKDELASEIENPLSEAQPGHLEFSITESLRRHYCSAIVRLLSNDPGNIAALADSSGEELRSRLIIWIAKLGSTDRRDELRSILLNDSNGSIRYLASDAMNLCPDTMDISALKNALNDTYFTTDKSGNRYYGVRTNASCALRKMGFEFEISGQYFENYTITKEPEK